MTNEEIDRVAACVSERVLKAMQVFVGVLEGVVRENEALRAKVDMLEMALFQADEHDRQIDDDDVEYARQAQPEDDGELIEEGSDAWAEFWGTSADSSDDDDDDKPTFD